ncbi:MAG: aminopeptidase [Candidatus Hermodarchaeota archaeon]
MLDPFCEKLAQLVINYSIKLKEGNRIVILGPALAKDLFLALQVEILKAGGHSLSIPQLEGEDELFFKYASDNQLVYFDDIFVALAKEFDGVIMIFSDYNTKKLSLVDPKKIGKMQLAAKRVEMFKIFSEREAKGEIKWVIIPYPCQSHAQDANMDYYSYSSFVEKALFLDKADPVHEWNQLDKEQNRIIDLLNTSNNIHVLGEDTDLTLSVERRIWENANGQHNLPDGEVFTGPIENSVNGHIRFTYPGIYQGREVENIYLEFKDGKVVNATADRGEDLLKEILKIRNANKLGEFAIGTNYGITQFTKNMLFDEKIGGTIHCALGRGFAKTGSKNFSTIHWDILKDMKLSGSKIIADEKVIYEEGKWKI